MERARIREPFSLISCEDCSERLTSLVVDGVSFPDHKDRRTNHLSEPEVLDVERVC